MARNHLLSCDEAAAEDEYIDMDISSSTTFLCYSITASPPRSREFEFQMSSNPHETDSTTSPADELFYKGKLLPLHLPPRLQMVQKLLHSSNTSLDQHHHHPTSSSFEEEKCTAPTTAFTTAAATPFESCNISPSDSCNVSRELSPEEYFYEYAVPPDAASFMETSHSKKQSWSRKLKLIKQSSIGLKLKASRAYLRSLFSKPGCSDDPSSTYAAPTSSNEECTASKYVKAARKSPFGQIPSRDRYQVAAPAPKRSNAKVKMDGGEDGGIHRRSFSSAIKRQSGPKSTSSSSSSSSSSFSSENSRGSFAVQLLKRSSSANSEVESSIQSAIAHCKKSQQLFCTRKSASDVGFSSLSVSRIPGLDNQEWPGMCRG
ncbi:hypothetical protein ACLOJK_001642 [Asimina triloba]